MTVKEMYKKAKAWVNESNKNKVIAVVGILFTLYVLSKVLFSSSCTYTVDDGFVNPCKDDEVFYGDFMTGR